MLLDRILLHSYHLYPTFFLHFRRIWNVFSCFFIQHIRKSIQQVVPECLLPNIQSWPVGGKGIWRGSYSVVQEWARFSLGLLALFQQVEALFQREKFSVLFQPLGERALMDSRLNWDFTHLIHFSKTANYIALTAIHKSWYQFAKCYLLSNCYARSWEYFKKKKNMASVPAVAEFIIQLGTIGKGKVFVHLIGISGCQILEVQKRNSNHLATMYPLTDFSVPLQEITGKFSTGATSSWHHSRKVLLSHHPQTRSTSIVLEDIDTQLHVSETFLHSLYVHIFIPFRAPIW